MSFGEFSKESFFPLIITFAIALFLAFISAKYLWSYSVRKGLTAKPNHRSSHRLPVPIIGGIILFFSIAIPYFIVADIHLSTKVVFIMLSFILLFIVGIIDDLVSVSVKIKLLGQFITAVLLILSLNNQELVIPFIEDYESVHETLRIAFWVISVVAIINAYNFIDGIDGLVIGLGSLSALFFGLYFYLEGHMNLSLLGFALVGGLWGLLYQNLSLKKKLFLGDTGALIIGGVISLFVLRYLEMNAHEQVISSSSMIVGILFVPVADLIRVFGSRLISGTSPLKADRTHIHHVLMDSFQLSHRRTSFIIIVLQFFIFIAFYLFNRDLNLGQITFTLFMFLSYFASVHMIKTLQRKPQENPFTKSTYS